ncbi:MAG: hypothetical protein ACR2HJ_05215 [Fimbriimonadales bacterium]
MLIAGLLLVVAQQTPMQMVLATMLMWEDAGSESARIVLRKNESGFGGQISGGAPAQYADVPKEYSHIEICLYPANATAGKPTFAKREQQFPVAELFLGEGRGLRWHGSGPVFYLDELSDKLKLKGGDDRLRLLAEGLLSRDGHVSMGCGTRLAYKGDDALAHIRKAIDRADEQSLRACVYPLGLIETPYAERMLIELYADARTRTAAAGALSHFPRPKARACYFDMVRRDLYASSAARQIARFGWKSGLPLIEKAMRSVEHWQDYETMFFAGRSLEGRPVPKDVAEAILRLTGKDSRKARLTLKNYKDVEAVAVLAVRLALHSTKGDSKPMNDSGTELLLSLDRAVVRSMLMRAVSAVRAKWHRDKLALLLGLVR